VWILSHMTKHDPDLSQIFSALGDATRRAILLQLGAGPASLGDLAQPTGLALPTVLRHVEVLQAAGLITTEKQSRRRICRARPEALSAARDWLARTQTAMAAQTDRLADYLDHLQRTSHEP
jgi:DNA-binding transcriptional ArsR family regulator